MGVRIHKEKKARHLLPGEVANLWPAWRQLNFKSEKLLTKAKEAYETWIKHRGTACGCKKGRDGGIYTCNEVESGHVQLGYMNEILIQGRSTVVKATQSSVFREYVHVEVKELSSVGGVLVKADDVITITGHLYDPDKDDQVQPPKGLPEYLNSLALMA